MSLNLITGPRSVLTTRHGTPPIGFEPILQEGYDRPVRAQVRDMREAAHRAHRYGS